MCLVGGSFFRSPFLSCTGVVLHHRLATYTSCFRVYRRSAVGISMFRRAGFSGSPRCSGGSISRVGNIVECPAVLEVRLLGRSKMKTLRTIFGHLGLLVRLPLLGSQGVGQAIR